MRDIDRNMPNVATYKNIRIHAFQSRERIENVVCPEIDAVLAMTRPGDLFDFCKNQSRSPEARLLAYERLEKDATIAAAGRQAAPVDLRLCSVSHLDDILIAHPDKYADMFFDWGGPGEHAARPEPFRSQLIEVQAKAKAERDEYWRTAKK
jgi:hypothetical protein